MCFTFAKMKLFSFTRTISTQITFDIFSNRSLHRYSWFTIREPLFYPSPWLFIVINLLLMNLARNREISVEICINIAIFFFLWNIVIKFAVPIKACILIEMRLNLSKCGPLTKYSLIFCYILDDLKMSLYTIYEAPGKLCFLYPTPFSSIFFFAPIFYLILHEFCPSYTIYIILLSDFPLPENGNGYFE